MAPSKPRRGRPRLRPNNSDDDPAEQILDVAATLFIEKGYAATSLSEIARGAGLQRASLYHHFANKDAMLAEIARRHVAPLLGVLEQFGLEDRPPSLQLYRYLRIDLCHMLSAPYDLGALFHLPEVRDRERFGSLWAAVDEIRDAWVWWIAAAAAGGEFDVADAGQAGSVVESSYLGMVGTHREELRSDPVGTADAFARFVLRSLLAHPADVAELDRLGIELDGVTPAVG